MQVAQPVEPSTHDHRWLEANAIINGSLWTALQALLGLPLGCPCPWSPTRWCALAGAGLVRHPRHLRDHLNGLAAVLDAGSATRQCSGVATHHAVTQRDQLIASFRRCSGYHAFVIAPLAGVQAAALLCGDGPFWMLLAAASASLTMVIGNSTVVIPGWG